MTTLRLTAKTSASRQTVWSLLADFANINSFNPNLTGSYLLEGNWGEIGVGTKRQCDIAGPGKNFIQEEIIEWVPGSHYVIDVFNGTLPVAQSKTTFGVFDLAQTTGSEIYMEFTYTPKLGTFGALLDTLILRHVFRLMLSRVPKGLARKAEQIEGEASAMPI